MLEAQYKFSNVIIIITIIINIIIIIKWASLIIYFSNYTDRAIPFSSTETSYLLNAYILNIEHVLCLTCLTSKVCIRQYIKFILENFWQF